jgi:hypothetical protein
MGAACGLRVPRASDSMTFESVVVHDGSRVNGTSVA